MPARKNETDFLFAQVGFPWDRLPHWREGASFHGPVYAGVMVVASAGMGRKLSADIPQLAIPEWLLARLAHVVTASSVDPVIIAVDAPPAPRADRETPSDQGL